MIPANQIRQLSSRGRERAEPVEIWKARKFINEHSDDELSLTKVAKFSNISGNHLSEKFKEVAGINFVDYVARIRVGKARHLLQTSNLRISEIAFAVGFQSLSQFNRVFKKLAGKSRTEYRTALTKRRRHRSALFLVTSVGTGQSALVDDSRQIRRGGAGFHPDHARTA
jgi:transcriptional regulator GlxA family with amidase domain